MLKKSEQVIKMKKKEIREIQATLGGNTKLPNIYVVITRTFSQVQ